MLQGKTQIRQDSAKYIRIAVLVIYDIMAVFLAEVLSIWTRFDFSLKSELGIPFLETAMHYVWLNIITTLIVFVIMHLYNSLWQYASVQELLNVVIACLLSLAGTSVGLPGGLKTRPPRISAKPFLPISFSISVMVIRLCL